MDRIAELVHQLEPETGPPPPEVQARQREALLASMVQADGAGPRPPRWRPRSGSWLVAIAGAAAVAVVVATVLPGPSSPSRPSSHPPAGGPATSAVLTAVTRALTGASGDVEEVRTTASVLSATSWVDLATGACRADTSVNGRPALTVFDEHGKAVIIDYGHRQWWARGSGGVTCQPLTPRRIEAALATGRYRLAGHATIQGQQSLELASTTTSSGPHPMPKLTTLWVNATTYLPVQSTSTGHVGERTLFTWLPATAASTAALKIAVPVGFQWVPAPPVQQVTTPTAGPPSRR
jgi:hypothetical protein